MGSKPKIMSFGSTMIFVGRILFGLSTFKFQDIDLSDPSRGAIASAHAC